MEDHSSLVLLKMQYIGFGIFYFNPRMGHLHHKEMCYFCWMLKQVDYRCKIFCIVSGFMNLVVRDMVLTLVANLIRGIWLSDI